GSSGRARFGWVHGNGSIGVVIVPPFGYEAVCAQRSLRHLADAAAAAGLTAVRFDLDGTGDSEGTDLDPDRVPAWLASIDDACNLARTVGADRIVLVGIRLGATLATVAAGTRDDVAGIVSIATVPATKALVREGRALQMQLGLEPAPVGVAVPPEDVHEVLGFAQTAETRAALSAIDLAKATRAPAPAMLVIDRDDLPPNDKYVAALTALGVAVEHARLPGYVEMILDPHKAIVPVEIIAATIAFAAARPALATRAAPHVELAPSVRFAGLTEEVVAIRDLTALATTRTASPRRAVILLNAGAVYRVGPNRLYVELARALPDALVIRIDQSGLGDSPPRGDSDENIVYSEHAIADVGAVVEWARVKGAREVAVVGLCSGAYHAIKVGLAHAVETIVPINPITFFWKPGMPLDFAAFRVTEDTNRYKQNMRSAAAWKKVLRGQVDLVRVARVVATRARDAIEHRGRDLLRRVRVPLSDDLGSELLALGRKGTAMRFIFAASEPGRAMLAEQGGSAVARLERAGRLSIDVIPNADHTFTPRWSHPLFVAAILRALR
ncbi:MAG TPA: alpha/beta fold hydrolase, partial [Kofleriaceae bacterium]